MTEWDQMGGAFMHFTHANFLRTILPLCFLLFSFWDLEAGP